MKVIINTMKLLTLFKGLHFLGLGMFIAGLAGYFFTDMTLTVTGMLALSCLIGVGIMIMSPYPIVLFLEWALKQSADKGVNLAKSETKEARNTDAHL